MVADDITFAVAGKDVQTSFAQTGNTLPEPYVFPGHPILHADYVHIERLRDVLQDQPNTIPIAVGSGTINDLVKRAAYEVERRYMVVATAASVDGYSSLEQPLVATGLRRRWIVLPRWSLSLILIFCETPRPK